MSWRGNDRGETMAKQKKVVHHDLSKRSGIVVERRTPNREVLDSIPQGSPCCVFEQDTLIP